MSCFLLFICVPFYEYQGIEKINIFAGDILAINNLLTKAWLIKWFMNSNTYNHNNIYNKIILTY